jgi:hypothetical protein
MLSGSRPRIVYQRVAGRNPAGTRADYAAAGRAAQRFERAALAGARVHAANRKTVA